MLSVYRPARSHRFVAWLACVAILFGLFAPSVAHALAAPDGAAGNWSEICTALGVKLVKVTDAATGEPSSPEISDSDAHEPYGKHCAYCQSDSSPALPPVHLPVLFIAVDMQRAPRLFYRSPRPLFAWASANPRAPPVLS
jgi:hypothetical protein